MLLFPLQIIFIDLYVTTTTYKWTLIALCTLQASCSHAAGQAEIQPLVQNQTSIIGKCQNFVLQIRIIFFWYVLDPKLKLFWKHHAMKFIIGGVNVEKVYFFYHKNPLKVNLKQVNYFFLMKKLKSSTFTPPILNFIALSF